MNFMTQNKDTQTNKFNLFEYSLTLYFMFFFVLNVKITKKHKNKKQNWDYNHFFVFGFFAVYFSFGHVFGFQDVFV